MTTHQTTHRATLGSWVKYYRQIATLTQRQLGLLVGCAEETIRKIEADRRTPSQHVATLLADALAIPPPQRAAFLRLARPVPSEPAPTVTTDAPVSMPLPVPATAMLGRAADLDAILALLDQPTPRLITLRGMGGVGKTRLALAIAQQRSAAGQPVLFLSLAHLTDGAQVLPTIAGQLGVSAMTPTALFPAVCQHLQNTATLLALDNVEQISGAAGILSDLVDACPHTRFLLTSRSALRIRGEYDYAVAPLAIPADGADLDALIQNPTLQLLVERVRAVRRHFAVTAANQATLIALCQRLEGLPLAVELVAAQCRVLSLEAMLDRLKSGDAELPLAGHDVPLRQQSLRATLAWSYALLSAPAQQMLRAMAVFQGSAPLGVLAAVGCPESADDAAVRVATLIENSLIHVEEYGDEPRFAMLVTVRAYAREHWMRAEAETFAQLHAHAMARRADQFHATVRAGDAASMLTTIQHDYPDYQAALRWAEQHDPVVLVRMCGALWYAWYISNQYLEGERWLSAALRVQDQADPDDQAALFEGASAIWHSLGDVSQARALGEQCIALRRRHDPDNRLGAILNNLALLVLDTGEYAQAQVWYAEGLASFEAVNNTFGVATVANNLAYTALLLADWDAAQQWLDRAEPLFRSLDDLNGVVNVLDNRVKLALRQSQWDQAARLLGELCQLPLRLAGHYGAIEVAEDAAAYVLARGDRRLAIQLWQWAHAERRETGVARLPSEQALFVQPLGLEVLDGSALPQADTAEWSVETCLQIVAEVCGTA